MKLQAIEALRYGALENGCLNELGEGLTVVLGPNESGKSTFTALTRHVLYGYPDGRARERGYEPAAGSRHARLVFASDDGEWAIDRVDGVRRGPVTVTTRRGSDQPDLLGQITAGVSEQAYRVVFGFGLDELAEIEQHDSADIVSRLYAAGAGLAVNPMDVRKVLDADASELYAPRRSKPVVNDLAARAKATRERVRELEHLATHFAAEQQRLAEITAELEPLKHRREELDLSSRALERAAQRVGDALEQYAALTVALEEAQADAADLSRNIELISVDEAALAAAPAARAVLAEAPVFRERLATIATLESNAAEAARKAAALDKLPAEVADSPELRASVERWRERLGDARRAAESARQATEQAHARAEATEALAAAESPAPAPRGQLLGAVAIGVLGTAGIVAGVLTGQWLAAVLGALLIVAAVVVALVRPRRDGAALSADAARLNAELATAEAVAARAAESNETALGEWRAWLAQASLDAYGDDPVAVLGLLDELRDRAQLLDERDRLEAEAQRERRSAEAWVVRLVDVARTIDPEAAQIPDLGAALELVERVRSSVEHAQESSTERSSLADKRAAAETQRDRLARQREGFAETIAAVAEEHDVPADEAADVLASRAESTRTELAEARDRCELLAEEATGLRTRLDEEGRDDAMARARQELEGLRAQGAVAADRYLVMALAVRLVDRARERYERERQPEVVRTAARVFSAMTAGRYRDLRVPLDEASITVIAEDGTVRSTAELSRGTAEQLYLALRVGLIASMGEMGRALPVLMDDVIVNFDPERRAGAVAAISELAAVRQVLFFTCHPETATSLTTEVPGALLVELDRCQLRG